MMKRILLCMIICLLFTCAAAETCAHRNLLMCSLRSEWVDMGAGHQLVYTKSCVCDDCSANIVSKSYADFVGHVFHMSESIHFAAEGMHLWVFICPECWHVHLEESTCAGGDQCLMYSAQTGERPPVQQEEFIAVFRALTNEAYVKRWLAQDRTK